ncbi:MAG TPA: hypothetical protein VHV77_18215 [Pirellulales bacterium]|jgi:hypothetical protein|nr:hypothetical protein [Pirellulales bacterium]
MDRFSTTDRTELLTFDKGPTVSVYLPTTPGAKAEVGRIGLKNLLSRAEESLVGGGMRSVAARDMLAPGRALLDDLAFWNGQSHGLALFLAEGLARSWRVPQSFKQNLWVGPRFYVKPMLPLAENHARYYVLAVSRNRVSLYLGDRYGLVEQPNDSLPKNLVDALRYQQPEGMFQARSIHVSGAKPRGRGRSKENAVFHGQGPGAELAKADVLAYMRVIDRGLHGFLHDKREPLVFAGVDYLFPLFQQANTYPQLLASAIQGNPDLWSAAELHERAVPLLHEYWNEAQARDRHRLDDAIGSDLVSCGIEEIVPAAVEGRVEVVFVAADEQVWGHHDSLGHVTFSSATDPQNEDLLDVAARETLLRGGRAYTVPVPELPAGLLLAARFRYGAGSKTKRRSANSLGV